MADAASSRSRLERAASRAPYLEREEEHALAVQWREAQDQAALHRLTQAHMRLVIAIAARFRNFGLPMSDLIQEGHVGLLEAAARFEPDRQVRFSTYATWWIRAAIQDYVLRNWSIVRGGTSSAQKALFFNLRRLRARLSREPGAISQSEMHRTIADALGVSQGDVAVMDARLSGPDASLNAPLTDGEGSSDRQDFLVDAGPLPDEAVGAALDSVRRRAWLGQALTVLTERELRIVQARRLTEGDGATLEALGASLGISKERVRQIEARALEKLKTALLATVPDHSAFIGP
jgi:RNA polymerase sigma-32 factor